MTVLKQAELGVSITDLIRKVGIGEQTFYRWEKQYVGMEMDQARQMKQLQAENRRLKKLVVDLSLDKTMLSVCFDLEVSLSAREGNSLQ